MRAHLHHLPDEHVAQVLMDRHDAIDGRHLAREAISDVLSLERAAEQRFEPAARNNHLMNCSRNRTSLSKNNRMSGIP